MKKHFIASSMLLALMILGSCSKEETQKASSNKDGLGQEIDKASEVDVDLSVAASDNNSSGEDGEEVVTT